RTRAVLDRIAGAEGDPADRTRRLEEIRWAVVREPIAALGDVAAARRRAADRRALRVGGAVGARSVARLGKVADSGRRAAGEAGGLDLVGGTVVGHAVAALGDVARAGGGAALSRALRVGGTLRREAGAILGGV